MCFLQIKAVKPSRVEIDRDASGLVRQCPPGELSSVVEIDPGSIIVDNVSRPIAGHIEMNP